MAACSGAAAQHTPRKNSTTGKIFDQGVQNVAAAVEPAGFVTQQLQIYAAS